LMVSKEPHAPSEVPICEASILLSPLIHPSAWKKNSANFAMTEFSEVREVDSALMNGSAESKTVQ
jgi:hypothetical protein